MRARTTRTVSRSQRVGGESAHEVEIIYRLGAGIVREPKPPAATERLRSVLLDAPAAARPGSIVLQAGTKWLATGVSAASLRALHARIGSRARVVCAPAEADAVREATGVVPHVPPSTRAWVETLATAETVVCVDTGAAHVAGMLCRRVVEVFPDAHFDEQVRRWRPWAAAYRAFRASEADASPETVAETILDDF